MFVDLFLPLIQVTLNGSTAFQPSASPSSLCRSWTSISAASNLFPAWLYIIGNYTLLYTFDVGSLFLISSVCIVPMWLQGCVSVGGYYVLIWPWQTTYVFKRSGVKYYLRAVQVQAMYLSLLGFFYVKNILLYLHYGSLINL